MRNDLSKVLMFFDRIGLQHRYRAESDGFLPGVSIADGILSYSNTATVGDILHEAGHLAVVPADFRRYLTEDISSLQPHYNAWFEANPNAMGVPEPPTGRAILQAGETEAIAWSYAAAKAAGVDTLLPFMDGFDGDGEMVHDMLAMGRHMGINGLHWGGMTRQGSYSLAPEFSFPNMTRWLQV